MAPCAGDKIICLGTSKKEEEKNLKSLDGLVTEVQFRALGRLPATSISPSKALTTNDIEGLLI